MPIDSPDPTVPGATSAPQGVDTAAIRALADAATEGPWFDYDRGIGHEVCTDPEMEQPLNSGFRETFKAADAAFIAAARTAVPALCDEVDRLRAVVEAVEALADDVDTGHPGCLRLNCSDCARRDIAARIRAAIASVTGGAR